MLTLDGPLEQHALRAQGLDLHLLWVVWILVKVSLPPLKRRLLALQESPGWTVRPRVIMMMPSSPSCLLRFSCLCHLESAAPSL